MEQFIDLESGIKSVITDNNNIQSDNYHQQPQFEPVNYQTQSIYNTGLPTHVTAQEDNNYNVTAYLQYFRSTFSYRQSSTVDPLASTDRSSSYYTSLQRIIGSLSTFTANQNFLSIRTTQPILPIAHTHETTHQNTLAEEVVVRYIQNEDEPEESKSDISSDTECTRMNLSQILTDSYNLYGKAAFEFFNPTPMTKNRNEPVILTNQPLDSSDLFDQRSNDHFTNRHQASLEVDCCDCSNVCIEEDQNNPCCFTIQNRYCVIGEPIKEGCCIPTYVPIKFAGLKCCCLYDEIMIICCLKNLCGGCCCCTVIAAAHLEKKIRTCRQSQL